MSKAKKPIQRLQLALISENKDGSVMKFQIGAQSYRGAEFGYNGEFYSAGSDMYVKSCSSPAIEGDYSLFVRGDDHSEDDTIMQCNSKLWSKIVGAVQDFNKEFMGTPEAVIDRTD